LVRVAVIGAGHWGPNLLRNFHDNHLSEVAWVCDTDSGRLSQVSARFPGVSTSTDVNDLFADESVDAVVIASPTTTHFTLAKQALLSGKHVLVEKPISRSSEEAGQLCDLAVQQGLTLMVGHVFVYNPAVQKVKDYLDEGSLGEVYYISMVRTNLGPIRMDVSASWDLASHDISILNYWLGTSALTCSATGGTWINEGREDVVFASLRYPKEVMVNLHVSWLNPRKARDITVVGERRMLTFSDMDLSEPIRIYDKTVTEERTIPTFIDNFASFRASVREGDITIPRVAMGEPLRTECDHFIECIVEGRPPLTGGPEGLAVVSVLEAIDRSIANSGQEEKV